MHIHFWSLFFKYVKILANNVYELIRGFMSQSGPFFTLDQLAEVAFNELCNKNNFIQSVVSAAKTKNTDTLKILSKQRNLLTEDNSKRNAIVALFLEDDEESASFLANFLRLSDAYLAEFAAQAGKKAIAQAYINKIEPSKRDYVRLAAKAAYGNHLALAEYFLGDNISGIPWVIEEAAYAGHEEIVAHFIEKLPVNKRNYDFLARCADLGKHPALANDFRQQQKSITESATFKKPQLIQRKVAHTSMPTPLYNKPAPMEPSFYPQFSSIGLPPFSAPWPDVQPPMIYQFGLPAPLPSHYEQSADQAPQTRTKPL